MKKRIYVHEKLLSNPLRGASNNALLGLIKPPAMRVVMTFYFYLSLKKHLKLHFRGFPSRHFNPHDLSCREDEKIGIRIPRLRLNNVRFVEMIGILALFLGEIHGNVSLFDQAFRVISIEGKEANANAGSGMKFILLYLKRLI